MPQDYTIAYFNRNWSNTHLLAMEVTLARENEKIAVARLQTEKAPYYIDDVHRLQNWLDGAQGALNERARTVDIPEFTKSIFTRRGKPVTMLRDSKGRFVKRVK